MATSPCRTTTLIIFLVLGPFLLPTTGSRLPNVSPTQSSSPSNLVKREAKTRPLYYRGAKLSGVTRKVLIAAVGRDDEGDSNRRGVVQSSPAHLMPPFQQGVLPPLPEFPTLGPPIVWSFPAAPMPPVDAPPPQDSPRLPGTVSKNGAVPPAPCSSPYHQQQGSWIPFVSAEPAVSPFHLQAPEATPEPTTGGPLSPPY